jgi:glycerophosphoryl diester phosphodiesterase
VNMNVLRIGHRGSKGYIAENTLESINHAILLGVDGIEIDIFKCLSGELVLSHENNLKRLTGKSAQLEKLTLNELKKFLVVGKYKIPTLTDVLTIIKTPLFVNIELKGLNIAQATSKIISDISTSTSWSLEHFIVSSFNWDELERFRSIDKNTPVGVLVSKSMSINEAIEFGKKINAQAIHPNFKLLNDKVVKKIKNNGFKIYTWTVNDEDDINFMKKLKVDGIISDYPDRI